ncbi:MAG: hypothetical protein ABIG30_03650 [Candidatus Aenigmatarchaeota archaeon]
MKGQEVIFSTLILMLIVIVLAGVGFVFFTGTFEQTSQAASDDIAAKVTQMNTRFSIQGRAGLTGLFIKNEGSNTIEPGSLNIYVDDKSSSGVIYDAIEPQKVGVLNVPVNEIAGESGVIKITGTVNTETTTFPKPEEITFPCVLTDDDGNTYDC